MSARLVGEHKNEAPTVLATAGVLHACGKGGGNLLAYILAILAQGIWSAGHGPADLEQ